MMFFLSFLDCCRKQVAHQLLLESDGNAVVRRRMQIDCMSETSDESTNGARYPCE